MPPTPGLTASTPSDSMTRTPHRRLAAELPLPVIAVARPDEHDLSVLAALGIARISFGPFLQTALTARMQDILKRWG